MHRSLRLLALCALGCSAFGCSAIIGPDTDRLGGDPDAGVDSSIVLVDGGGDDAGDRDGGDPTDAGMMCPPSCDDGVPCTSDACESGSCVNRPIDAACGAGMRCNPVMGCVAERCSSDGECDDGMYCTGEERCESDAPGTGCVAGTPVVCSDDHACTMDTCNEVTDSCSFAPNHTVCDTLFCRVGQMCDPGSGCTSGTARDCRDGDPCTTDSCNETADRCDNPAVDGDMDGHPAESVSGVMCAGGTDCDDGNGAVHPGATELCNGFDDNCNGMTDEGCGTTPDDCGTAAAIPLGAGGMGSVRGSFSSFTHDYQTSAVCGAQPMGRDAVYYIDLPSGIHDVEIDTIGSAADTVLAVAFTCSNAGFQAACDDDFDRGAGTASRIWLHRVGSSTSTTRVYILVDGYRDTTAGDFVVNVARRTAAGDGCVTIGGTPAMDISGGGTALGFSSGFVGGQRGSCQSSGDTSPEALFRVTGPGSGNVDFDVYSADFVPDIYLRSTTCTGTEVGCDVGSPVGGGVNGAFLRRSVTSGRQYYFFVDGGRGAYVVYYSPR